MGDSMNKHSTGNSNPNVLSSSDSNNRRGNNSGSGEQGSCGHPHAHRSHQQHASRLVIG